MKLIKDLGMKFPNKNSTKRTQYGLFECEECGSLVEVSNTIVKTRGQRYCQRCACIINATTHGDSKRGKRERLFIIWDGMRTRCRGGKDYENYGGRGIKVCDDWNGSYQIFKTWALSHGYSKHLSIDRKNNDGNYEPDNCRWATSKEQSNNRRPRSK